MTRAKFSLFIIGNKLTLSGDSTWKDLISHLDEKRNITQVADSALFKPYYDLVKISMQKMEQASIVDLGIWRVCFSQSARFSLKSIPTQSRTQLVRSFLKVCNGEFPLALRKSLCSETPPVLCLNAFEYCFVLTIYLESFDEYYQQILKVWSVVDKKKVADTVRAVSREFSRHSPEFFSGITVYPKEGVKLIEPTQTIRTPDSKIVFLK